jgi:hypothetical protein
LLQTGRSGSRGESSNEREKAAIVRLLKCLRQEPGHHEAVLQEDHAMEVVLLRKSHPQNVLPAEVAPMAGEIHAKQVL